MELGSREPRNVEMPGIEQPSYAYSVDRRDRLIQVDDPWLRFAAENGAPQLTRDLLYGRSIWEFVSGSETCALYQLLFERVRADHHERRVPFRCDSPDCFRFMELQLAPGEEGGIDLRGVLLRLLDEALPRGLYRFPACGVCRRIFAYGEWLEAEEAIRRLGAFDTSRPPALEHTICDPCRVLLEMPASVPAAP